MAADDKTPEGAKGGTKAGAKDPGGPASADTASAGSKTSGRPSGASPRKSVTIDLEAREVRAAATAGGRPGSAASPDKAASAAGGKSAGTATDTPAARVGVTPGAASPGATGAAKTPASSSVTASPRPAGASAARPREAGATATAETAASSSSASGSTVSGAAASVAPSSARAAASSAAPAGGSGAETPTGSAASTSGAGKDGPSAGGAAEAATGGDAAGQVAPKPAASSGDDGRERSATGFGGLFAASLIGAAVALGGVYGAQQAGFLGSSWPAPELQSALQAAQSRIAGLEEKLAGVADRQDAAAVVSSTLDGLRNRIDTLEGSLRATATQASSGLSEEASARLAEMENGLADLRRFVSSGGAGESAGLASLEQAVDGLKASLADLARKVEELPAPSPAADLSGLESRVAGIEASARTLADVPETLSDLRSAVDGMRQSIADARERIGAFEAEVAAVKSSLGDEITSLAARVDPIERQMGDAGAREIASRAVAVSQLKAAVDRGAPYATELAAVAGVMPDGTDLSALRARAGSGIPTRADLRARFGEAVRAMSATLDKPDSGDVVDSLLANARSLVSVRTPGESDAATPVAALGRMEARVDANDLAGAVEAYDGLPESAKAAGAAWIADARARLAADALVDEVTRDVLKSLGETSR